MKDTMPEKPKGAGKSSFELIEVPRLTKMLPIAKDMTILDLACGMGAYSLYFSEQIGEQGLVYGVDLWEEGLSMLQNKIDKQNISNILTIHADASKNIDIDDHSVDLCLMATVLHDFHEAGQTDAVIRQIKRLLKPHGCLAVIEFKKMDGPPGPPIGIRLTENNVKELVTPHGFQEDIIGEIGPYNYIITFKSNI